MEESIKLFSDLCSQMIYIAPLEHSCKPADPQSAGKLKVKLLPEWPVEGHVSDCIKSHFIAIDIKNMPTNFPNIETRLKHHFRDTVEKLCGSEKNCQLK